jgi:hypothetical protein
MSLRFPYVPVPLRGAVPATLPVNATAHWRPLLPVRVINAQSGTFHDLDDALLDTGADDCLMPLHVAQRLGVAFLPEKSPGARIRWRGTWWPIRYGDVRLQLNDGTQIATWPARIAFSQALHDQPILGRAHCLQFFEAAFRGSALAVDLDPIATFPGTIT